jgi:hypothetical protein
MPIPDNYRDICQMLLEASNAGRVNWVEDGANFIVRLPQFNVHLWAGVEDEKRFVAFGLKDPGTKGYLDNWWLEEGDQDFETLQKLYASAKRSANRLPDKLEELRALLKSNNKVG